MKICIPTMDDHGLKGMPSDHFGSAPFFTFVDTETGEVETQPNGGAHHVHGACRPLDFLGSCPVDATVSAFKDGRLGKLTSEEACHGGEFGHGRAAGRGWARVGWRSIRGGYPPE